MIEYFFMAIGMIALIGGAYVRLTDNSGASSYEAWKAEDEAEYSELYD